MALSQLRLRYTLLSTAVRASQPLRICKVSRTATANGCISSFHFYDSHDWRRQLLVKGHHIKVKLQYGLSELSLVIAQILRVWISASARRPSGFCALCWSTTSYSTLQARMCALT